MSHRIKRFAAFAIFALFYHFAAVDSILGFRGHHVDTKVDTKSDQRNDEIQFIRCARLRRHSQSNPVVSNALTPLIEDPVTRMIQGRGIPTQL